MGRFPTSFMFVERVRVRECHAKKIIDNISDKRKQNVKVVIGNRAEVCDAILYIIKSNYGLIVSVDDAEEIKFCEELFEKATI